MPTPKCPICRGSGLTREVEKCTACPAGARFITSFNGGAFLAAIGEGPVAVAAARDYRYSGDGPDWTEEERREREADEADARWREEERQRAEAIERQRHVDEEAARKKADKAAKAKAAAEAKGK